MTPVDLNRHLKIFLDYVKSYRESGDHEDGIMASEYHSRLIYHINSTGKEPNWNRANTSKEEFFSYIETGRFTIQGDS